MKPLSKLVYLAVSCAVVVAIFAFVGPRTVHAVVAALVRDVDNPARHPFQASCQGENTISDDTDCFLAAVPAGQELVIAGMSVRILTDTAGAVDASVQTTVNGIAAQYEITLQNAGAAISALSWGIVCTREPCRSRSMQTRGLELKYQLLA